MRTLALPKGVKVLAPITEAQADILSSDALDFFAKLQREFNPRRLDRLRQRALRQQAIDRGEMPNFFPETAAVRDGDWRVSSVPADLQNRRVEITGPVDRKMVINALNSGANCYMADLEDAHSPMWEGTLDGQLNLRDAVRGEVEYVNPEGKRYCLNEKIATLLVRPRGWHLPQKQLLVDGQPASASLFDFALYFFHNARHRVQQRSGIYFYLPKLEHYLEARLWNDVFIRAQELLEIPRGSIKATVLILFSYIKKFARKEEFIVPDRAQVTMTAPFMRAYALSCIKVCHKRGAFAMGGMAAYIPIKTDPSANEKALLKVREDKRREATDGHDGTWVAHPGLVSIAREEFDKVLGQRSNQIDRQRDDVSFTPEQLLEVPKGSITEEGLRMNIRVGIQYIEAWLGGLGCVPLYNLMEDAATAEISRTQVWQWVHNPRGVLEDGRKVTLQLVREITKDELERIRQERGEQRFQQGHFPEATRLFDELVASSDLEEFLTLKAYDLLD